MVARTVNKSASDLVAVGVLLVVCVSEQGGTEGVNALTIHTVILSASQIHGTHGFLKGLCASEAVSVHKLFFADDVMRCMEV